MMQIAGIQKTTLVDYPGKVAATIFTRGCSFRCPFCHNPELVLPEKFNPLILEEEILTFLNSRVGKLEGVCITGGEPTIQSDIIEFICKVKKMGFFVKLDTNGSQPERLREIIDKGNVDYIAMDIKSSLRKYEETTNVKKCRSRDLSCRHPELVSGSTDRHSERSEESLACHSRFLDCHSREGGNLVDNIQKSISLIMNSGIDYEFRTTVCHPLHEIEDFEEIRKLIKGAKRYFIQNFVKSKQISELQKFKPFTDEELEKAKNTIKQYVKNVKIR